MTYSKRKEMEMGGGSISSSEHKISCPECLSKFTLKRGRNALPSKLECPRCHTSSTLAQWERLPGPIEPEGRDSLSETTSPQGVEKALSGVINKRAVDEEVLNPTPESFELGDISSTGGLTESELEQMESFARSLRADLGTKPAGVEPLPSRARSQQKASLDGPKSGDEPAPELRKRLQSILNDGGQRSGAQNTWIGQGATDLADQISQGADTKRDQPSDVRRTHLGAGGSPPQNTWQGPPRSEHTAGQGAKALLAARAGEERGSGFIVLPTQEIREAVGEGIYRLRIAGREFGPVDVSGVVTLIKHGVLMGADEIAEPNGEWTPILEHPAFVRVRSKMATAAHLVLKELDVSGKRLESEANTPRESSSAAASPIPAAPEPVAPKRPSPEPAASESSPIPSEPTGRGGIQPKVTLVALLSGLVIGLVIGWWLAKMM